MQLVAEVTLDFLNTVPAYVFRGTGITLGSGKTVIRISTVFSGEKRQPEQTVGYSDPTLLMDSLQ